MYLSVSCSSWDSIQPSCFFSNFSTYFWIHFSSKRTESVHKTLISSVNNVLKYIFITLNFHYTQRAIEKLYNVQHYYILCYKHTCKSRSEIWVLRSGLCEPDHSNLAHFVSYYYILHQTSCTMFSTFMFFNFCTCRLYVMNPSHVLVKIKK